MTKSVNFLSGDRFPLASSPILFFPSAPLILRATPFFHVHSLCLAFLLLTQILSDFGFIFSPLSSTVLVSPSATYLGLSRRAAPVELRDAHALLPRLTGRRPNSVTLVADIGVDVKVSVVVGHFQSEYKEIRKI